MKIAIDIDDCVCNTMDCDFNFAYIYIKNANNDNINTIMLLHDYNKDYKHELNKTASCWVEIYTKITNKIFRV